MISFAIGTHNEGLSLRELVIQLSNVPYKRQIVIVDDNSTNPETLNILKEFGDFTVQYKHSLDSDFATHKNFLNSKCTGDYIFNIDADELVALELLNNLPQVVKTNPVDMFSVARLNTVEGITLDHVAKWGWRLGTVGTVEEVINWPDYQTRIYKNSPEIKWFGKVHERIIGHKSFGALPDDLEWCLFHHKTIARQEAQNSLYDKIQR